MSDCIYYSVMWTKSSNKKNKTYEDGFLILNGKRATLQNEEGKQVTTTLSKQTEYAIGEQFSLGSYEVDISSIINADDYLSGRVFLGSSSSTSVSAPPPSATVPVRSPLSSLQLNRPKSVLKPFKPLVPTVTATSSISTVSQPSASLSQDPVSSTFEPFTIDIPELTSSTQSTITNLNHGRKLGFRTPQAVIPVESTTSHYTPLKLERPSSSTSSTSSSTNASYAAIPSISAIPASVKARHNPFAENALVLHHPLPGAPEPHVVLDPFLSQHLRGHQRDGVRFAWKALAQPHNSGGRGCILADDMGLGKTLQAISVMWTALKQGSAFAVGSPLSTAVNVDPPAQNLSSNVATASSISNALASALAGPLVSKCIIACPATLVGNWRNEIKKWLGDERCRPVTIGDGAKSRGSTKSKAKTKGRSALDNEEDEEEGEEDEIGGPAVEITDFIHGSAKVHAVLILSYEMLRAHSAIIVRAMNKQKGAANGALNVGKHMLLICDEGHRLKNAGGNATTEALKALPCPYRLLLTGTPIQNDLNELFALVDFVSPQSLGELSSFKRVFTAPISRARDPSASAQELQLARARSAELQQHISALILRRTSKVLEKELPTKVSCTVVVRCDALTQIQAYNDARAGRHRDNDDAGAEDTLLLLDRLRKIASVGGDISSKSSSSINNPTDERDEEPLFPSGKLAFIREYILSIARDAPSDRLVIVANYTKTLDQVARGILHFLQVPYLRLDGSTDPKTRASIAAQFSASASTGKERVWESEISLRNYEKTNILNYITSAQNEANGIRRNGCQFPPRPTLHPGSPSATTPVLLLSAQAGGAGLNLTGANRLLLLDAAWNPAVDQQAMARIWRVGQPSRRVFVHRLLSAYTVDEKVLLRQLHKSKLSEVITDSTDNILANMEGQSKNNSKSSGNSGPSLSKSELEELFLIDPEAAWKSSFSREIVGNSGVKDEKSDISPYPQYQEASYVHDTLSAALERSDSYKKSDFRKTKNMPKMTPELEFISRTWRTSSTCSITSESVNDTDRVRMVVQDSNELSDLAALDHVLAAASSKPFDFSAPWYASLFRTIGVNPLSTESSNCAQLKKIKGVDKNALPNRLIKSNSSGDSSAEKFQQEIHWKMRHLGHASVVSFVQSSVTNGYKDGLRRFDLPLAGATSPSIEIGQLDDDELRENSDDSNNSSDYDRRKKKPRCDPSEGEEMGNFTDDDIIPVKYTSAARSNPSSSKLDSGSTVRPYTDNDPDDDVPVDDDFFSF